VVEVNKNLFSLSFHSIKLELLVESSKSIFNTIILIQAINNNDA